MIIKTGFEIYEDLSVTDFNTVKWIRVNDIMEWLNDEKNKSETMSDNKCVYTLMCKFLEYSKK